MDHRRHRPFAVGACDMQRGKGALGMIQRVAKMPDVLEAQLDAEGLECKETIEQFSAKTLKWLLTER